MAQMMSIPRTRILLPPARTSAGMLTLPHKARGIVLFADASGRSRFCGDSRHTTQLLQKAGLATFTFDLLTAEEIGEGGNSFNVPLLAERLLVASEMLRNNSETSHFQLGCFANGPGAAAALLAAAQEPSTFAAVVSAGGRPDLAGSTLARVQTPTRLLVGSRDNEILTLNEIALARMHCKRDLKVISGAWRHFAEPGALDRAVSFASLWFRDHLDASSPAEAAALGQPQRSCAAANGPARASLG